MTSTTDLFNNIVSWSTIEILIHVFNGSTAGNDFIYIAYLSLLNGQRSHLWHSVNILFWFRHKYINEHRDTFSKFYKMGRHTLYFYARVRFTIMIVV